jgi:hypothetical protein
MLLLTATPHKGDPVNFSLFLQLLDADAYADVRSIREAMDRRRAPFYLRRTKEAMVYFPERRPDGTWVAEKIFTKRIPNTVDFQIDGPEFELYRDITRFVKQQSAKAAAQGEDPRARAIGFLMSLYQRRLASSTYAMRHSLNNRVKRLTEGVKRAQELCRLAPADLPSPEELEEMEESEREPVERIASVLILPHPERETPEIRRLRPNFETESIAMEVVMEYEKAQGRQVYDVHEKNLGYDITSLHLNSGELRLIEVKGIGESSGTILLTPNERRVAEDRRDCYWLYVVTNCNTTPQMQEPIKDPARFEWNEVIKVAHYYLSIDAMTQPRQVKEDSAPYGEQKI